MGTLKNREVIADSHTVDASCPGVICTFDEGVSDMMHLLPIALPVVHQSTSREP